MAYKVDEECVAAARDRWTTVFDVLLLATMDSEMKPDEARRQVQVCADLADEALNAYERRWQ